MSPDEKILSSSARKRNPTSMSCSLSSGKEQPTFIQIDDFKEMELEAARNNIKIEASESSLKEQEDCESKG